MRPSTLIELAFSLPTTSLTAFSMPFFKYTGLRLYLDTWCSFCDSQFRVFVYFVLVAINLVATSR